MDKLNIAVYPYAINVSNYIGMMIGFLQEKYNVIDYQLLKNKLYQLDDIDVIYINWLEDSLSNEDRNLIMEAKEKGINIVWVFHNRAPHDGIDDCKSNDDFKFMIRTSTNIIIHSKRSIEYLKNYVADIDVCKVHYIPHPDFIGEYYSFGDIRSRYNILDNNLVLSLIGNIRRYKNIEFAINAFHNIRDINCKLLIAGGYVRTDSEYVIHLKELANEDSRIIIDAREQPISSMEMKSYLDALDVLVLPYNKRSSMNSGVMLMAFSYNKTVIVPDIAMADDFDDKLIYKYHYESEEEHLKQLKTVMEKVIADGKHELEYRGKKLFEYTARNCSKELVKNELYKVIDNGEIDAENRENSHCFNSMYDIASALDASNYRANIAIQFLHCQKHNEIFKDFFNYNEFKTIAVYGYGQIGKYLVAELEKAGVSIAYVIDRNAARFNDIQAYTLEDDIPMVDVVIVTASGVNCLKERLRQKGFKNIVAISDILECGRGLVKMKGRD